MKLNARNLIWAASHPMAALRYLKYRDTIPYEVIARHLPDDPVILEAGAADGSNTLEMAQFWPRARLHAFEPVPSAKKQLDGRVSVCADQVRTYPLALGETPGTFTLNLSGVDGQSGTQSSSLLAPSGHLEEYDFVRFGRSIDVEVTTIDAWAAEQGVVRIDFMWLDLQGFELKALAGAKRLLPTVKAIHVEVQHRQLYEGAPLYPEVLEWMRHEGFMPVVNATSRISGNILFARTP